MLEKNLKCIRTIYSSNIQLAFSNERLPSRFVFDLSIARELTWTPTSRRLTCNPEPVLTQRYPRYVYIPLTEQRGPSAQPCVEQTSVCKKERNTWLSYTWCCSNAIQRFAPVLKLHTQ